MSLALKTSSDTPPIQITCWESFERLLNDIPTYASGYFTSDVNPHLRFSISNLLHPFDGSSYEALSSTTDHDGVSAEDRYTQGDCELLALALDIAFGKTGSLVAVYDEMHPGSTEISDSAPYLIHAGYEHEGYVYDIQGRHNPMVWAERWLENGNGSERSSWGRVSRLDLEAMQGMPASPEGIRMAYPFAMLVRGISHASAGTTPALTLR